MFATQGDNGTNLALEPLRGVLETGRASVDPTFLRSTALEGSIRAAGIGISTGI
jgi:hypothetical protein